MVNFTITTTNNGAVICNYEGRKLYVFSDLKNFENPSDYIRSETKTKIYAQIREEHPEVFKSLNAKAWFREKYSEVADSSAPTPRQNPTLGSSSPSIPQDTTPTEVRATTTDSEKALLELLKELKQPSNTEKAILDALNELKKPSQVDVAILESIKGLKQPSLLETSMIEAIIAKGSELSVEKIEEELKTRLGDFIKNTYGILPKTLKIQTSTSTNEVTGVFHEKFKDILTMVANDVPVMVTGQAGTGKNHTMEQIAQAIGVEFYYSGAVTQEYKITGFIDAGGVYHETEFYKAFKHGGLFMLDEVDASAPEVLVILNGAIANRYFDFPNGRIKAHKDFRVVCAGNTYGTGADMIYVGRNVLDGATLDRFVVIKMDYDATVETNLCPDEDYYKFIIEMRKSVGKNKLRHIIGMRASINGYKALTAGLSKKFVIESIVFKGMSKDDLNLVVKNGLSDSDWCKELKKYHSTMEV